MNSLESREGYVFEGAGFCSNGEIVRIASTLGLGPGYT